MRGKLCDEEDTPEPASPATASPATTRSTTYSVDGVDVPVAALAQAMAVRDLMNRDSSQERQLLKAAAKRDSSIAKDTATWRKYVYVLLVIGLGGELSVADTVGGTGTRLCCC